MALERTLILAKPDAVSRNLSGQILARFERRGLGLRAARLVVASRELGETHYAEHAAKPFFGELVDFITSGPTLAFVLEGEGAIAASRRTIGATNPASADPGSLRGDFALAMPNNLVHGSDSLGVRRTRDRAVVPRWARLTTPRATARSGRESTASTPTAAPRTTGRSTRSRGASGRSTRASSNVIGDVAGLDVVELGCGTAYFSVVARPARRAAGRGRRHAGAARDGAPPACRDRDRVPARRGRRRPRPASPTGASTWSCPNTAPRSGSIRTAGSRRRRGCSGRAAASSSSATRRS